MPSPSQFCTLAVTKSLKDSDAEKLCEYFAARLRPSQTIYNGRKGILELHWSSKGVVTTFNNLAEWLQNIGHSPGESVLTDVDAYAYHADYIGRQEDLDKDKKPKYPSHVIFVLPNHSICLIRGASGVPIEQTSLWISQGGMSVDVASQGVERKSGSKWIVYSTKAYIHPLDRLPGDEEVFQHGGKGKIRIRIIPNDNKK